MNEQIKFTTRLATMNDLAEMKALKIRSVIKYSAGYLTSDQIDVTLDLMGVDTELIKEGRYYVAENEGKILGGGGWSMHDTVFGKPHPNGWAPRPLVPKVDAARIRDMYTHADHGRIGVGAAVLLACEAAAVRAGFCDTELLSTIAGEPLFLKNGYIVLERLQVANKAGIGIPMAKMSKHLL